MIDSCVHALMCLYMKYANLPNKASICTILDVFMKFARALVAVDPDHPRGTEGRDNRGMSVLQQHVAFFDRNKDGVVYPWETYQGLRAIGCGIFLSFLAAIFINLAFSYFSLPGPLGFGILDASPVCPSSGHPCMHGGDSQTYDTEGRFVPSKFDAIFSKYAVRDPNALSFEEMNTMLKANSKLLDLFGRFVTFLEWQLLYALGKDEQGLLQRETVRGMCDGSLFEHLEK